MHDEGRGEAARTRAPDWSSGWPRAVVPGASFTFLSNSSYFLTIFSYAGGGVHATQELFPVVASDNDSVLK